MAREPGSGEIRFPLRRAAEPVEEPAPPPPVRSWRPKSATPDPLELVTSDRCGLHMVQAHAIKQRTGKYRG